MRLPGVLAPVLVLLVLAAGCVASRRPPGQLMPPFREIALSDLREHPERYNEQMVAFPATVERVEDTTGGVWLHLKDDRGPLVLYVPVALGGNLRNELGREEMRFAVRVGERRLTPLGQMALEVMPLEISRTRYFDQAVPIERPAAE